MYWERLQKFCVPLIPLSHPFPPASSFTVAEKHYRSLSFKLCNVQCQSARDKSMVVFSHNNTTKCNLHSTDVLMLLLYSEICSLNPRLYIPAFSISAPTNVHLGWTAGDTT